MNNFDLLAALQKFSPADATESAARDQITTFVANNVGSWWQRGNLRGHVTASAFVVNAARTHILLLHHAALGKWLQPGGHIDDSDATPAAAALREAHEETGLPALELVSTDIFDVDAHHIPARIKDGVAEPAHTHYDIRYLVQANDEAVQLSEESLGFRWIDARQLTALEFEESTERMARKVIAIGHR